MNQTLVFSALSYRLKAKMIAPMLTKSVIKIKDKMLKNIILKVLVYIIKI